MAVNLYGDERRLTKRGFGIDIASQRADDLDIEALSFIGALERPVLALDLACGAGGQTLRMAQAGAVVTACDIVDYGDDILATAQALGVTGVSFVPGDMRTLAGLFPDQTFDVIVCQRAIHYLPHAQAVIAVRAMAGLLRRRGRLYLSASGLDSELGNGYPAASLAVSQRYTPLAAEMVERHGIFGPVCLYAKADLLTLIEGSGLRVVELFTSPFGNVKAILEHG